MALSNISYPYPVLGNNDDVTGAFAPTIEGLVDDEVVTISVSYNLEQSEITQLIEDGVAQFVTEARCSGTFFRQSYMSNSVRHGITIPSDRLRERVELNFYVVASTQIDNYSPGSNSPVFEGASCTVYAGEVLAVGGSASINIDKEFDPLSGPARSFIQVRRQDENAEHISVDYEDSEYIIINIPRQIFDSYSQIKSEFQDTVHAAIILPALVDVIYKVSSEDVPVDAIWLGRINEICQKLELDMTTDEPLKIAQAMLKAPIARSVVALNSREEEEDDE